MRPATLIFFSFSQKQIHLNSTWWSLSDHRFYCCNFFTYIFVLQRLSSLFTCYFYYPDYEILIFCTYNYLCKSTAFFSTCCVRHLILFCLTYALKTFNTLFYFLYTRIPDEEHVSNSSLLTS